MRVRVLGGVWWWGLWKKGRRCRVGVDVEGAEKGTADKTDPTGRKYSRSFDEDQFVSRFRVIVKRLFGDGFEESYGISCLVKATRSGNPQVYRCSI